MLTTLELVAVMGDSSSVTSTVNPVHRHDLHAPLGYVLEDDHERWTCRVFRLTEVCGQAVHERFACAVADEPREGAVCAASRPAIRLSSGKVRLHAA